MATESDWSMVKVEGQLATLSLDVVKEGFRFGRKLKRAADVARARLSLKRTVEQMTIDNGWAPVIVSPENMPIRCLVDILRNGNLADVQATVLRHIVTHHSTELFRNVRKQKIEPITVLKLLGDVPGDDYMQKLESQCGGGPVVWTTISPKLKDIAISPPISIKFCVLKGVHYPQPSRRAHITLSENLVRYLRKDGPRSTDEEVANIVSNRLDLFAEIRSKVAINAENDHDMVRLLEKTRAVISIQDKLFISGVLVPSDVLVEIRDEELLTAACYESLAVYLSRLLRDYDCWDPSLACTIEEAVFYIIVGSCIRFEAAVSLIPYYSFLDTIAIKTSTEFFETLLGLDIPGGRHHPISFSGLPFSSHTTGPAGVIDTLIQGLQFVHNEALQMYWQPLVWSGENSFIEIFVEHKGFPGILCKLEIGKGKISILRAFPDLGKPKPIQISWKELMREAILQLQGIQSGLHVYASLLTLRIPRGSPDLLVHTRPSSAYAMNRMKEVLLLLSRIWKAFTDELHNFEPSLENMMSARKYRGLEADILKGFELTVIDWNKIAIAGSESADDVSDNLICPEATGKILGGEIRLDELYIDTMLSLVDDKDFKLIRHEEKCIDALWVSNYYGVAQEEALFPELHKACSVFFDTIDNYYVSVPTLKKLLVIYKDPGTDINLKESLFKQRTGSAAGENSRLVFLELASAIRPSSSDPGKVSISEAIRKRNIADAVEGIIFKYGKVEEKIRENLHRDVSLWKRSHLKKSDIMRKVGETTRGILAKEDLAWLERELVATWGKMGMVKIPQLCNEESSEHEQYYRFAKSHGSDKQRIMHYITMDTPVPAAGVVVIEDNNDEETLVCAGGVDLEKSGSYLGAPLYRMKGGKSRRRKRKSQHAKIWEVGYIE